MQKLPAEIILRIIHYVAPTPPLQQLWTSFHYTPFYDAPEKTSTLIMLLQLCRSWREPACLLFYQQAAIEIGDVTLGDRKRKTLLLSDPIFDKNKSYARMLCISLSVTNLSQALYQIDHLARKVTCYPTMPLVRHLTVEFVTKRPEQPSIGKDISCNTHKNSDFIINGFVKSLHQTFPNMLRLATFFSSLYYMPPEILHIGSVITQLTSQVWGTQINSAYLSGLPMTLDLANAFVASELQSITIDTCKQSIVNVELVIRSRLCLRRLHINSNFPHKLDQLISDKNNERKTHVYPQLQHLITRVAFSAANLPICQPLVDPFPQLETLICSGSQPFSSPIVFLEGRNHIRHLELSVDLSSIEFFMRNHILEKGLFCKLKYLSLQISSISSTDERATKHIKLAVELGTETQILKLNYPSKHKVCGTVLCKATLPINLQHFNAPNVWLTIDQMFSIFSACPHLKEARLWQLDKSNSAPEYLQKTDIDLYKRRYKMNNASISFLYLNTLNHFDKQTFAQRAVLLACLLHNIKRIEFDYRSSKANAAAMSAIDGELRQTIFETESNLRQVEFGVERTKYYHRGYLFSYLRP